MAYLQGFGTDVFISYSHADDKPVGEIRWVQKFCANLRALVRAKIGKPATIWLDQSGLDGTHIVDDHIPNEVRRSAILVSVLSPNYVNSEWCNRELDAFL